MSSSYALYSSSNDQVSFDQGGKRRPGIFLSRPVAIACVVGAIVAIVAVGLIVGLTVQNCPEQRDKATAPPPTAGPTQPPSQAPTPTPTQPAVNIRLPLTVLPRNYTLLIAPYLYDNSQADSFYFKGEVAITAWVNESTQDIYLHRERQMNISGDYQVMRNGVNLFQSSRYEATPMWDVIHLKETIQPGNDILIKADFIAPLKPDLKGLYLSSYKDDTSGETKYIATSQLQSIDARKTFPCFDEPKFKATFDITIVRKDPFVALSNMESINNETILCNKHFDGVTGNCIAETYGTTPIMSTYILAFVVSEFGYIQDFDDKNRLYRNWARPDQLRIANYAMEAVINMTNYFEEYFDVPFPLNKTDQVAAPDFNAGAMENWGLIIYRETRLLYDQFRDTASIRQAIDNVIAHEVAHMWFGNLVTPDWWDDIWLNEGFASFVQNLGVGQLRPDWEIDAQFVPTSQRSAFNVDSKGASHPIYMEITTSSGIEGIFDTITYRKGASVLRQLYHFVGDEIFRVGVGNYLKANNYSNAFHTELHDSLNEAARARNRSIDVRKVMETWIRQMGHPVINCTAPENGNLHLTQNHFLSDPSQTPDPQYPSAYNYTWIVPITMVTQKNATGYKDKVDISSNVVWMHGKEQRFSIDVDPNQWYLLNMRSAGFYRINYDTENWNRLIGQLNTNHTIFTPHDRSRIIEDSFALAAAGYIDYSIPMNVTKYLSKEEHYVPWLSAMSELAYLYRMLSRESPLYGPFSAYMQTLMRPEFAKMNLSDPSAGHLGLQKDGLFITYACLYGVPECQASAVQLFREFIKDGAQNISQTFLKPDVRARILCEGIRGTTVKEWDVVFDAFMKESHPGLRNDLMRSLSCSRDPWVLSRLLEYSIDDTKIRRQDTSSVVTGVASNPIGLQVVFDFVRGNWDLLREKIPGGFTLGYFVQNFNRFNTQQKLREVEAFKTQQAGNLAAAARSLDLAIEDIKVNTRWMEQNLASVEQWLGENTA